LTLLAFSGDRNDMAETASSGYVVPQPRIPKVIGILNITFGAGLLMCGLCMGVYVAVLPTMMKAMTQVTKQAEEQQRAQVKTQLGTLEEEEKAAKTEEERIELARKKQELEDSLKRPTLAPTMDMDKMGLNNPRLVGYMWAEVATGLVMNVALLVSGILLVRFKPSGLRLGLWVAGLKIVRLLLLYSFFIVAIVPWYSRKMAEFAVDMIQQQAPLGRPKGGAPPVDMLIRTYTITYTATGVAVIVAGSIYPLVCLWLLSRPGARAACLGAKKLEETGDAW
jgi:hypothetical protein